MNSEEMQISSTQLMFSVGCFVQGSSLILSYATANTKSETWLALLIGFIISLPFLGIYFLLSKKYPGMNIVEISILVFGNTLGRILSLLYIYYFFSLAFLNAGIVGNFMNTFLMAETPPAAFFIFFIFTCAYAVQKGVDTMTRYSTLFVGIMIFSLCLTVAFMASGFRVSNLFPVFTAPAIKYFQSAFTTAISSISEVITFFMIFPYVDDKSKINRALLKGVLIGAGTIFVSILATVAVLGPITPIAGNPTFEAMRMINVGDVINRIEVLYALALTVLLFFKVTILLFAVVKGLSQVFNLHSYRILTPSVSVLTIIFTMNSLASSAETESWNKSAAVYASFFEVLLPGITLAVCSIKSLLTKKNPL